MKNAHPLHRRSLLSRITADYRKYQILTILCNQCFQAIIWPIIQCFGAADVITMLYLLLTSHQQMGMPIQLGSIGFVITATCACCVIPNYGSMTIVYSSKVLKIINQWTGCSLALRFARSCSPISLKIGEFHKMDKGRAPAFIRFVLQRTVFFVLKTQK